jgi:TetR/AcrR family transcriptional regulator, transcriptional repressor for nem operon
LSADVARADAPVKNAYQRKLTAYVDRIAELLDGHSSDRQRRAWSILALMVGSIVISRGIPEGSEFRTAPIESALTTACKLIGPNTDDPDPANRP